MGLLPLFTPHRRLRVIKGIGDIEDEKRDTMPVVP